MILLSAYYGPKVVLNTFHILIHLVITMSTCHYNLYFTKEETKAQRS